MAAEATARLEHFGQLAPPEQRRFHQLQLLRTVFGLAITFFVVRLLQIDTPLEYCLGASVLGVFAAGRFVRSGQGFLHAAVLHFMVYLLVRAGLWTTNYFLTTSHGVPQSYDFAVPTFTDQLLIFVLSYACAFLSTWLFWTRVGSATLEGLIWVLALVWFLAGHRNYHLDAPKQVSSLTWKWQLLQRYHIEPQHLFMGLGVAGILVLTVYFIAARNRPVFGGTREIQARGRLSSIAALTVPVALLFALAYYVRALNDRYEREISRQSEGVEGATKPGESNLGFHKAVGHTNQPTALVRLEGDYEQNPWAPMLYLREGSLSEFNGHEFVAADLQFDQDVPRTDPSQPFISSEDPAQTTGALFAEAFLTVPPALLLPPPEDELRTRLIYTVYLLTKHNTPPAIDLPVRIGMVKNPDPNRFQAAYQVVSMSPTVKPTDLIGRTVGNPRWDGRTLDHYLRAPGSMTQNHPEHIQLDPQKPVPDANGEDLRYAALSEKLTAGITEPLARAEAIINYLSAESIYTRDPGHEVPPEGDPVAPYLFAEKKRGYCVHFAHAAVYMLRLAGIPARIGTGYLTDLQFAKDGHILLQMGDRHAWPEVYIDGLGWTIWDVSPAQAENEQTPVPDAQLLEELMTKLNPTDELIAPPEVAEPKKDEPSVIEKIIDRQVVIPVAALFLALFLLGKIWLRVGYRFARTPAGRVRLAYTSFASQMEDMGVSRHRGETRQEFRARLEQQFRTSAAGLVNLNERFVYSREKTVPTAGEVGEALRSWQQSHDAERSRLRRYLSFFNPRSLLRFGSW